ncbi:MAG: ABC transporter substrate-binding protein, partial [Acidobacteriota bacterium]
AGRLGGLFYGRGHSRHWEWTSGRWKLARLDAECSGVTPRGVNFRRAPDSATLADWLRSGEIDLARDLANADLNDFMVRPSFRRSVHEVPSPNTAALLLNRRGPLASAPKLRRLLLGVLDPRSIVWRGLGRFALPTGSWIPPGILGHDPDAPGHRRVDRFDAVGQLQDLRVGRQRADSRQAGGSLTMRLRGIVHPIFRDKFRAVLEAVLSEWSLLGLEIELEEMALADLGQLREAASETDFVLTRWYPDYRDPDAYFSPAFKQLGGVYGSLLSSPELEKHIDEARNAASPGRRQRLYRRLQRILIHQDLVLPLFHEVEFRVASPSLSELGLTANPPYVDYRRIGWKSEPPTAAQPTRRRGRLRLPLVAPLENLDIIRALNFASLETLSAIFEGLMRIDSRGAVTPHLAASITAAEDGLSYRLSLRDALFHDGRRVRVQDVRSTLQRALRHGPPALEKRLEGVRGAAAYQAGETRSLLGFEVLSERTFNLHLTSPDPLFPVTLSHPCLAILPEPAADASGTWRDAAIGTGPFRVVDFEPGRRLELAAFERYWRAEVPRCRNLAFERPENPQDLREGLESGYFHVVRELGAEDFESFADDSRFAGGVVEHPAFSTFFVVLNRVQGPFAQAENRRLFCRHLAAAAEQARARLGRHGVRAGGLIPPGLLPAAPRVPPSWLGENAAPAGGLRVEIAVHPLLLGQYGGYWRSLRDALAERGVELAVAAPGIRSVIEGSRLRSMDAIAGRWSADLPDASSFAQILHSDLEPFGRLVSHERIDRLIERGAAEDDPSARHAAFEELERQIALEALVWPLFHQQICCVAHPEVRGLRLGFGWPSVAYEELSLGS